MKCLIPTKSSILHIAQLTANQTRLRWWRQQGDKNVQHPSTGELGADQFPMSSTGRDKCNTAQVQSIVTSPNLHRKGSLPIDSFQFYDQFCMDLHSSPMKSWKQTSKTNQRPMCTRYCSNLSEKRHVSRSTLSAHTAVEFNKNYLHYKHFNTTETCLYFYLEQ